MDFNNIMKMEAIRVAQGKYFLKMFKDECQKFGVDIHKGKVWLSLTYVVVNISQLLRYSVYGHLFTAGDRSI